MSKVKTERNSSNRVVKTVQLTDMSEMRAAQRTDMLEHKLTKFGASNKTNFSNSKQPDLPCSVTSAPYQPYNIF